MQRVSVRRARIEEQRARKQIVIAIGATLLISVVFFFLIFPLMLRAVVYIAQQNSPNVTDVQPLPPQTPVIAAPDEYNNSGQLEISGYTAANVDVTLLANEQSKGTTTSDNDGLFKFSITLGEGDHEIYLFAADSDQNTSPDSTRYKVVVDKTAPDLTVDSPRDGTTFTLRREQNQTVRGLLSEPGFVFVNSSRIRTDSEGVFQAQIQLDEGGNDIKLVGEDLAGNQTDEIEISVRWVAP